MPLPAFYHVSDTTFYLKAEHRGEIFEIDRSRENALGIRIKAHVATHAITEAAIDLAHGHIKVRHVSGEPLSEKDQRFLSKLPRMLSFLGVEDSKTQKFNELFYGLFWESVPF